MIRLAFAELRADMRLWIGPLLVAGVASVFVSLVALFWWSLGTPAGTALIESFGTTVDEARAGSFFLYISTAIPAIAVLGSTAAATITALSARIARWRLAGATSRQVRTVVTVQVLIVNTVGTLAGIALAAPLRQPAVDLLVRLVTHGDYTIPVDTSPVAAAVALAGSTIVCSLASFAPARRAARIPAVHAVREGGGQVRAMGIIRWIVVGLLASMLVPQAIVSIFLPDLVGIGPGQDTDAASLALIQGMLTVAIVGALGPVIVPGLIRGWMALVPARVAPALFIARHFAVAQPREAATAAMPLSMGIGLFGAMFGVVATWQAALVMSGTDLEGNTLDIYVMLAPAAAIAIAGSVASILLTTRSRTRRSALLRTAGASPRDLIAIAFAEAAGYSITAIVLGLGVACSAVLTATSLLSAAELPATPVLDLRQMAVLAGAGIIVLVAALLVPAVAAIRGNPRDLISA